MRLRSKRADGRARLYTVSRGYGVASHTRTVPIFLGIVLTPLATGAFLLAAGTALIHGAAIALLSFALVGFGRAWSWEFFVGSSVTTRS